MQHTNPQRWPKKSAWWWAYFALSILVFVASMITGWRWPLRTLLLAMLYGVGLVGLWGYLRNEAIGHRTFWVGYFYLVAAGAAYSVGATLLRATHLDAVFLVSLLLATAALSVPAYLALWRYAFRSSGIWRSVAAA